MQKQPVRLLILASALLLCMAGLMIQLFSIISGKQVKAISVGQGQYHLHVPLTTGTIYDRNYESLNHPENEILAVVNPTPEAVASIFAKLRDRDAVSEQIQQGAPFICRLTEEAESRPNLYILHGAGKGEGALPAQHLIGYRQNGEAMSGLELAYADWLSACDSSADITFSVSAHGDVLAGAEQSLVMNGRQGSGIVTTLDRRVQVITEQALAKIAPHAGAAVVMECKTGNLAACASFPVYNPDALADAMKQENAPFLNRALSAFSVGSIFKLVTASSALENGIPVKHMYTCDGAVNVYGQRFRCHQWNGHGLLDMQQALIDSCNPYFISLSALLSPEMLHDTAAAYGFGQEQELADGLFSAAGYLQSEDELRVEAERANFSFGQGRLLATPVQIAAMTACIANDGIYSEPNVVLGITNDGSSLQTLHHPVQHRAVSSGNAAKVRRMMVSVIEKSKTTNGKPENNRAGGKTSTAQTGKYDENGKELCHAWMTGFFPVNDPKYAVTVFVEYGGSGNQAAAPVFREIIEKMTEQGLY